MSTNDERLYYIRLSIAGFMGLTVKQEFLNARPIVKTPADEEADTAAVLYVEADNLSFHDAMRAYKPSSVVLMDESGGTPVDLGNLAEHATLPTEATHVIFALNNPKMGPFELAALVRQADQIGAPMNQVIIPYGADKRNYLATGELPQ